MKPKIAKPKRLNLVGNGDSSSNREVLTTLIKQWRHKFGYYSIFVAVPALLASHVSVASSDEAKKPEASVASRRTKVTEKLNISRCKPELLKRQSAFRLPHQGASFNMLTALGGNDDCPGRIIPGGQYTAALPFIDSGDTTGANNTVTRARDISYCYYATEAHGPDHVYTFILTSRGENPEIRISRTSGSYQPLAYVLDSRALNSFSLGCPTNIGNDTCSLIIGSASPGDGIATLNSFQMNLLPLNVPLHLFVDSLRNDGSGSGPYTIRMMDVTIAPAECHNANPIDCAEVLVRQQYFDFLNREADVNGLTFWINEIASCGGDAQCIEVKRINVSAAFFLSIEFQETGYLVYKTHAAAFGATRIGSTVPLTLSEFLPDQQQVSRGVVVGISGWEARLEANQVTYFDQFVQRPAFLETYPTTMTSAQYVDALNTNAGGVLSPNVRNQLVADLASGAKTRAQVLRAVVQDPDFTNAHFNRAFVLMQYFGYLRRNPSDAPDFNFNGYNFWLSKLNQFDGNFIEAEMVKAFLSSIEYRQRFGQP